MVQEQIDDLRAEKEALVEERKTFEDPDAPEWIQQKASVEIERINRALSDLDREIETLLSQTGE